MTPSEQLVAAADLIRDLASKTSTAPWAEPYYDNHPGDTGWWVLNGGEGMRQHAVCSTFALNKQGEADARWIAALSPAIAPALESWLRQAATELEQAWSLFEPGTPRLTLSHLDAGDVHTGIWTEESRLEAIQPRWGSALKIARVVLGVDTP